MSWNVNGETVTAQQIKLLRSIATGPGPLDSYPVRVVNSCERHGWVESEVEEVHITAKGKALLAALDGIAGTQRRGASPRRILAAKPRRGRPPKAKTTPSGNGAFALADYQRLRSEIEARYQADLAALDRACQIVQVVLGDGGPRG